MPPLDAHKNPRLSLKADHAGIDALIGQLVGHVRADERMEALRVWEALEPALLAHLDAEEAYLLPALEEIERAECDRTRREHAQIRRTIGEIGMALELHTAREEPILAFCAFLEAHAEREDSVLYASAERHMPMAVARSLVSRLQAIRVHSPVDRAGEPRRAIPATPADLGDAAKPLQPG